MSASTLPVAPVALAAGDRMPETTAGPLTRTDFVRYAGAGGDLNPIHHDEPMAVAAGFPTVFGMGMLHAGMLGLHRREQPRHERRGRRGEPGQPHAPGAESAQVGQLAGRRVEGGGDRQRVTREHAAGLGETDPTARPADDRHADAALEPPQVLAEGRLGHAGRSLYVRNLPLTAQQIGQDHEALGLSEHAQLFDRRIGDRAGLMDRRHRSAFN